MQYYNYIQLHHHNIPLCHPERRTNTHHLLSPSPNHTNCKTWNASPITIVVLWPTQLYRNARIRVWNVTDRTPITAMNVATSSAEKFIT